MIQFQSDSNQESRIKNQESRIESYRPPPKRVISGAVLVGGAWALRAMASRAMSAVEEIPWTLSLNSSTFEAQRSASSYEICPCSKRLKIDWSNVCIPYCEVPCAMAV